MRDAGLEQAIRAAGGVASLARAIGIAQPSVSSWSRIPAERVLAVEAFTRVERSVLRPDLYGSSNVSSKPEVDEIDQLRAAEYGLLSLLLGKAPDAGTLARVAQLKGDASELGMAHVELAMAAAAVDDRAASKEFFDLFIGLGRGELLPYASYYLTGFLHERPLARVREDLDLLGIERAGPSREPEDHIAILLEVMAGLARGDFEAEFAEQTRFFDRHLKPWAARMFVDLEMSGTAKFYRAVGRVGRVFMELEAEAFTLSE
ncbi:molecular chaperone TorD family protein [Bradyrhizobium sp. JYMT SZCCT0180]|uniref:molecular chaperone TorD family protein n=1 Tax=Bradyrhizobium sp. JYMT SZCCT0180 TaxID=2807666 RepID=UPI001BA583E8|nr:molecular chaperone TorD family protein [Bradyrhizobium sp. JYMT SZCCT0180]MBR1212166.1 molecular chaperone TorD family protein [Bradyrhizobium sp. JYMT SZCCT0180]